MLNKEIDIEFVKNIIRHELTHWDEFNNWKPTLSGWEKVIFNHGIGFKKHAKKFNIPEAYMGKNTFNSKYFYYFLQAMFNKFLLKLGYVVVYK